MIIKDNSPCWCNAGTWEVIFQNKRFGLLKCTSCSCYRTDPPPLTSVEQSTAFYTAYYQTAPQHAKVQTTQVRQSRFWYVADQLPELQHPLHSAIDIGCGDGQLCAELHTAGWEHIAGLEVSRTRILRAREKYPDIDFYDVPIQETGIAPATQDMIVMDNVIEHLPSPVTFLDGLRPYLKSSGQIVVITPNMQSGNFLLLGERWTPELAPHTHIYLFTHQALARCLNNAGFSVRYSGTFHLPLYKIPQLVKRFASGDVKGALWRTMQESGAVYSRLLNAGPMLYAVATPTA